MFDIPFPIFQPFKTDWKIINDGVMGGMSRGNLSFTSKNTLIFNGFVSLENNGGFSSFRSQFSTLNLEQYDVSKNVSIKKPFLKISSNFKFLSFRRSFFELGLMVNAIESKLRAMRLSEIGQSVFNLNLQHPMVNGAKFHFRFQIWKADFEG